MYVHFPTRRLAARDSASSLRLSLWSDACTQRSAQHDPAGCTVTHHDGADGAMNPMPAFTISPSCYTFLFLMPPPHSGRSSSIESSRSWLAHSARQPRERRSLPIIQGSPSVLRRTSTKSFPRLPSKAARWNRCGYSAWRTISNPSRGSGIRCQVEARELSSRAFVEEVGNERRTSRVAATVTSEEQFLLRMQTAQAVPRGDRSSLLLVVPEQPVRWSLQVSAQALALALVRVLLVQVRAPRPRAEPPQGSVWRTTHPTPEDCRGSWFPFPACRGSLSSGPALPQ